MRTISALAVALGVCAGCAVPAGPPMPVATGAPLDDSMACRNIVGQAEIDGVTQQISAYACRQADGTWQVQQGADGTAAAIYPLAVYPYYPYYDPWWYWGPPVSIGIGASFVFVDRFHHFHHVDHMHFGQPNNGYRSRGGGFHGMGGGGHFWGGGMSGGGRSH
jgi:surface antigen